MTPCIDLRPIDDAIVTVVQLVERPMSFDQA